jgi:hypothetical protein
MPSKQLFRFATVRKRFTFWSIGTLHRVKIRRGSESLAFECFPNAVILYYGQDELITTTSYLSHGKVVHFFDSRIERAKSIVEVPIRIPTKESARCEWDRRQKQGESWRASVNH